MRAAILNTDNEVTLSEVPRPTPGADEVLLRVEACGICGTDLHAVQNGWQDYALGHEVSAIIEEVGEHVRRLSPGQRVAVECFSRCGECRHCRQGRYNLCTTIEFMGGGPPGGLAEYMVAPAYAVHVMPDALDAEDSVLVEPTAVAVRAVRRSSPDGWPNGRTMGILGAGTIGLLCTSYASAHDAQVAVLAKHDHQVAAAEAAGASRVVKLGEARPSTALPFDETGLDSVIDTVSRGTSLNTAIDICRKGGRVVLVGEVTRPMMAALSSLVHGEKTLTGSFCYAARDDDSDFGLAVSAIMAGQVRPTELITHRFPLDDLQEAFRVAGDKTTGAIKAVVTMPD